MTTPTLLRLRNDDVMQPQPWPIVLDADGCTIISGRPDAATIIGWASPAGEVTTAEPRVGFTPIFAGEDGKWFSINGTYLAEEPKPYTGDLDSLRRTNERYRKALTGANA